MKLLNYIVISLIIALYPRISYSLEKFNLDKIDDSINLQDFNLNKDLNLKNNNNTNNIYYSQIPSQITPESDNFSSPEIPSSPQKPLIETLPTSSPPPSSDFIDIPGKIIVKEFKFVGNTAFSEEILTKLVAEFINKEITFAELISAEQKITKLYLESGYINSGAIIEANQTFDPQEAIINITIIEGSIKEIDIQGLNRLNENYIKDRLEISTSKPFNVNKLFESLQLLQLNPLIENISAELAAGIRPEENLLFVNVKEADSFDFIPIFNNGRNSSVGSFRRGVRINEKNLLGFGDNIDISYANTDGSDTVNASYTIPVNAHNGKITLAGGFNSSKVIKPPFDILDITGYSEYYEIGYSQPVIQHPEQELTLGLKLSIQYSESYLQGEPFPISIGSDINGNTDVTALRFYQDFIQRNANEVFAMRSQFSLGIEAFGANTNENAPDTNFFAWRTQAQYVRKLAEDTLFITRGDLQLASESLVSLEQFYLGGLNSVRGYPQDLNLTDNGFLLSTEVWLPILRVNNIINDEDGVLQIIPFVDFGVGWNAGEFPAPDPNALVGVGLGLQWQMGNNFTARLDWGIPLVDVDIEKKDWNENGIYFNINAKF